jgi:hypothetical protein
MVQETRRPNREDLLENTNNKMYVILLFFFILET